MEISMPFLQSGNSIGTWEPISQKLFGIFYIFAEILTDNFLNLIANCENYPD